MSFFSIIVPVYKTEDYLCKCIDSILSQTCTDFELILVDDGSPDNAGRIIDEYAKRDNRVKVFHKPNGGVSSARNLGISKATGQYVWFVDSDDYIMPDSLQQLYETVNEGGDLFVFNTNKIKEKFSAEINSFLQKYYFTYILGFEPWNKLYSNSIIQENGLRFDEEETIGEDLLFNIYYYKALFGAETRTVALLGEDYYCYVERNGSAMNTASKNRIYQQLRLFEKIITKIGALLDTENISLFFICHIISGILQSQGLGIEEFAQIEWNKYSKYLDKLELKRFFRNEHASFLGRMRIKLFFEFMKNKKYKLAGRVMGLK